MKNLLKLLFTEADNKTWCISKMMGFYAFLHYHVISAWEVLHVGTAFDPTAYGTGLGALFATLGVLLGLKKETKE